MSNFMNPPTVPQVFQCGIFFFNLACFADSVSYRNMITITKVLMGNSHLSWPLDLFSQEVAFLLLYKPVPSDPQHCSIHITAFQRASTG